MPFLAMKLRQLWQSTSWWWCLTLLVMGLAAWLRLSQLSSLPPSPYWEEVALGYDAYSLLKTGRDHHGNAWPVIAFESFGDWKPSGYFYALLPSIQLFGLSVLAIRLPSALAGIGIVWLLPFLVQIVAARKLSSLEIFMVRLLAALCPWLIIFSRGGWEVNLATFLLLAGSLIWWQTLNSNKFTTQTYLKALAAVVVLVASMYTYHAMRMIAPLWVMGLTWAAIGGEVKRSQWKKYVGVGMFSALLGFTLLAPVVLNLNQKAVSQRFQETSIFSDPNPVLITNALRAEHHNAWWARAIYHRYWLIGETILTKLTEHLTPAFLFVAGDPNARHRSALYGQLLYPDAALILMGIYWLIKRKQSSGWLLAWLWLGATLPAALTTATPHALRTLPAALIWISLASFGVSGGLEFVAQQKNTFARWAGYILAGGLLAAYLGFSFAWWHTYTKIYPVLFAQDWQYGYQQMISTTQALAKNNPDLPLIISRQQGRPAMYWWFYNATDPKTVQGLAPIMPKDQGEFLQFANLRFSSVMGDFQPDSIVALSEEEWKTIQKDHPTWRLADTSVVRLPNHQSVWLIGILRFQ